MIPSRVRRSVVKVFSRIAGCLAASVQALGPWTDVQRQCSAQGLATLGEPALSRTQCVLSGCAQSELSLGLCSAHDAGEQLIDGAVSLLLCDHVERCETNVSKGLRQPAHAGESFVLPHKAGVVLDIALFKGIDE